MYYHKWPSATIEDIAGYTNQRVINGRTMVLNDIPAGTPIKWNSMNPTYVGNETDLSVEANKAVAELMVYCGTSVKMVYGTSSSASTTTAATMLKKKFDYSPDLKEISRYNYSLSAWTDIIYNELKEKRPVLYSGSTSSSGHAFVVDGYNGDELFHVNWGWGGSCDGYFMLTVMNPDATDGAGASASSDGYSSGQSALIGIRPNDGTISEENAAALTFDNTSVSGATITFGTVGNYSGSENSFNYTIATMDEDGTLTPISNIKTVSNLGSGWYYSNISFTVSGLPDGKYKIVPVSRVVGTEKWIYNNSGATEEYIEAEVVNGNVTLSLHSPVFSLEATNFSYPGSLVANTEQPVNVTIKNLGDEFYGTVYLFASQTSNKGIANGPFGITVTKGNSIETTLFFTPTSSGSYTIWVTTDINGENVIGQSSVTIKAGGDGTTTNDIDLVLTPIINNLSKDGKYILGNSVNVTIKAENSTQKNYNGHIGARVYSYTGNGGWTWNAIWTSNNTETGNSSEYTFTIELNTNYKEYAIVPIYNKSGSFVEYGDYTNIRYTLKPAITYYTADGNKQLDIAPENFTATNDIVAIDLRGNSTTKAVTSNNPNCLYMIDNDATAPTGVETNVIQGDEAEEIILTDGYPFFSPFDFTAKKISYTRIFNEGYKKNGSGWSTIVLPFTVENVSIAHNNCNYDIDWFRHSEDKNKDFWVMEYTSDNADHVYFSHASEMVALRPYIITVPGSDWGTGKDLTGLSITFLATNAPVSSENLAVTSGDYYKMKGSFAMSQLENVYGLNDQGTLFVKGNATVEPFKAFFMATTTAPVASTLAINVDNTTGINIIETRQGNNDKKWYTISGSHIDKPTKKGIYIHNGKKVVVK